MNLEKLSLSSLKLCSPLVIFMVYVIVSGISLFMTRNTLKKFKTQRMENLYNLYSWNEVKFVIVFGVILYGLCQYEQMNLAWLYLIFPIIYIILKNVFVFAYVSIAHQNAPKEVEFKESKNDFFSKEAGKIYPEPPIVKKEVDTTIFGMRGDQDGALKNLSMPPTPPTVAVSSTPINNLEGWTGGNGPDFGFSTNSGLDAFFP